MIFRWVGEKPPTSFSLKWFSFPKKWWFGRIVSSFHSNSGWNVDGEVKRWKLDVHPSKHNFFKNPHRYNVYIFPLHYNQQASQWLIYEWIFVCQAKSALYTIGVPTTRKVFSRAVSRPFALLLTASHISLPKLWCSADASSRLKKLRRNSLDKHLSMVYPGLFIFRIWEMSLLMWPITPTFHIRFVKVVVVPVKKQ